MKRITLIILLGIMFASCNDKLNDNFTIKRYFKDEQTGLCYSYFYLRTEYISYIELCTV